MMTRVLKFSLPALATGLILSGGASAQVVEDRPGSGAATAPRTGQIDTDRTPNVAPSDVLRRVSEILSGEVRGPGDERRIATISDMIMDAQGAPHYLLLSRGGVVGVGGDTIAVPFGVGQLAYLEDGGWRLELNMTGEQLDQAPTLEAGSLAQLRDANWLRSNQQFFQADRAADPAGTGDDSILFRASALRGAQVRGIGGDESIANVDDVLLDAESRASHAILGYGGVAGLGKNQVPVPFRMLRLETEPRDDRYVLRVGVDMTKDRLQSDTAPKLDGEYNRLLDPTFVTRVDEYFGQGAATGAIEANPLP